MLVLKTNIYKSKLIVIQHFASLDIEHYELNTDFMDGLYLVAPFKQISELNKIFQNSQTLKIKYYDTRRIN